MIQNSVANQEKACGKEMDKTRPMALQNLLKSIHMSILIAASLKPGAVVVCLT